LIPFDVVIPPGEIDRDLTAKLQREATGILAWAIAGAVRWRQEGLGSQPEVERAMEGWREDSDPLKDFLEERCRFLPAVFIRPSELHRAYESWCDANGEKVKLDRPKFNERLIAKGCSQAMRRFDRGYPERIWNGVMLHD
jgi:putative DNA primase/helicase